MHPLQSYLLKTSKQFKTFQCMVSMPKLDLQFTHSSTTLNQPFHSASVGKLFTTILIMQAIEEGRITLDTPVSHHLNHEVLDDLFFVNGVNYQSQVTIQDLLSHTSGVNDYFESKTMDGSSFINEVLHQPQRFYTPLDLIQFTQKKQKPVGIPKQKFHYSDTGFILLGLCCESLYQASFNTLIQTKIVQPCGLKNTFLCFYDERFNAKNLAPLWMNGVEVSQFTSLSCDFSGGGLHTTTEDLTLFLQGCVNGVLLTQDSLNQMTIFNHKFRNGLHYGLGCMQLRPKDFFFLFKKLPLMIGHLGVSGVHAWIDVESKMSIVLNVGNNQHMAKSFQVVISLLQMMHSMSKRK